MKKQHRISVSFSSEYENEYKYVLSLNNASDFVCRAIRYLVQNENVLDSILDEKVAKIVSRILSNGHIPVDNRAVTHKTAEAISDAVPNEDLIKAADFFEL